MKYILFVSGLVMSSLLSQSQWTSGSGLIYYNGGNVGIGTTSPQQKLHVAGTIKMGDYTYISEPHGGLSSIFSNNLYAGVNNNTIVRNSSSDPGSYININYTRGIIFGTGVTSAAGTEVSDNINERMRIDLNGNVGIGTSSPATLWGKVLQVYDYNNAALSVRTPVADWQFVTDASGGLHFRDISGGGNAGRMYIGQNGNVLIGKTSQTNASYKLDINGNARANKIVVNTTGADFVFEEDYSLRTLEELQKYIRQNKRLPEIPSAKEMEKEGLDVGEMNIKLLQKIEELTLYLIEQNKKLEEQSRKINDQQREMEVLKKQVQQDK